MSLRIRLFLLFGGLICGILAAQWWMWQSLRADLETQVGDVAFSVGRDMAATLLEDPETKADSGSTRVIHQLGDDSKHFTFTHVDGSATRTVNLEPDKDGILEIIGQDGSKHTIMMGRKHAMFEFKIQSDGEAGETTDATSDTRVWVEKEPSNFQVDSDSDGDVQMVVIDTNGQVMKRKIKVKAGAEPPDLSQERVSAFASMIVNGKPLDSRMMISLDDAEKNLILANNRFLKSIPIPKNELMGAFSKVERDFFLGSGLILIIGLLLVAAAAHRFAEPLRKLARTAQQVGNGSLGLQVAGATPGGEVGIAITEFNRMSERLEELDEHTRIMREKQSLTELGEVANGLAHTIRNPLNTLGLSIDQMASLGQNEVQQELAQMARAQIRRIDQWIRSFLALASQGVSREEAVKLDGVLQDVVLEAIQDGRGIEVDVDIDHNAPAIKGVAPELRAVFQALVINAVEASPEGRQVQVRLKNDEEKLVVTVRDEGAGLPQQVRDKLFTPHVTTKETGSGMGLFLAHRIITSRYQGTVTLEDGEPTGTIATVTLPLVRGAHE